MSTIFPGSASVGQIYEGYLFNGIAWDIVGIDLTADYPEIIDGKISASVIPSTFATTSYVNQQVGNINLSPYLTQSSASTTYITQASASTTYATKTELNNIDLSSASAAAVAAIVDSAPSTLNTLNELAAALGDDANYASTITTALGNKLDTSTASSLYLTQASASTNYLTKTSASSTYLTQINASTIYATKTELNNIDALPSQSGNSGKYLTTNGSAASWGNLDLSLYAPKSSPTFTGTVSGITKSMVGLGNVENTALSTWTGSSNITSLGTVATGTWSGTAIGTSKGGTGLTSLGTSGQFLKVNSGATALEWASNASSLGYNVSLTANYSYAETQKLLANDLADSDNLGESVAISSDGNTMIVGAALEDTSPNTTNGAAYIYVRSAGVWTQQAKILASDAASGDQFGYSVSISSDGNTAIIGAFNESTSPNTSQGAAYVFTRSGSTWTQQQKIVASDAASSDIFGYSVALSSDSNTAIVGAISESTSPNTFTGAAYVFTRSGSTWTQQQKIVASDAANSEYFGYNVSLSSDGSTAMIGVSYENTSPNSYNGAAYVFTRSGSTWTQQAKLLASDAASNEFFGTAVSLSSDGNTALIGSMQEDASPTSDNGAAYVFTRSGSTWTQQAKLLASDKANQDYFGNSVSISSDGNIALIGARGETTSPNFVNGAAYLFTRSGSTWTQQQKILASDVTTGDQFGWDVSISGDGNTVIVGATTENPSGINGAGCVYVFNTSLNWASSIPIGAYTTNTDVRAASSASNYIDGTLFIPTSGNSYIIPSNINGSFTLGSASTVSLSFLGQQGFAIYDTDQAILAAQVFG
jgi:hypothetical protein